MLENRLLNLGFAKSYFQEASQYEGLFLGRVVTQYKDLYKVATVHGELMAEISGKLRYASDKPVDYPAVGDFVMIDRDDGEHGHAIIHHTLSRKSVFLRKAAGTAHGLQVVAANIDTVFICMSLYHDFNLRRLERYLSVAWESGATPVIVLTKADLSEDLNEKLLELKNVAIGVDILVTSSITANGYLVILKYIAPGQTVAFLGSSGVGKSTLINRLLGNDLAQTGEVRKGGKGRHVTTRRELIVIPTGGAVIDTPGMRELGVESVDLASTFSEIEAFAGRCKFKDCQHEREPGCAVRAAIAEGRLAAERLVSYQKLQKEAKYDRLNAKQIEKEKINDMFSGFGGMKNARDYIKSKEKNKS